MDLFILELRSVCTVFLLESVFFSPQIPFGKQVSSDLEPQSAGGISSKHKQGLAALSQQVQ